jgi:hypothetical protein
MIEIDQGITIETGIQIGNVPVLGQTLTFVTEDGVNYLISETGNNFVEIIYV